MKDDFNQRVSSICPICGFGFDARSHTSCPTCGHATNVSPEEGSSRRSLGKELLDREDRHAILAENLAGWLGAAMLILGVIAYLANMSGLPSRGVVALTLATAFVIYYYRKEPRDPLWKPLLILGGMWLFVGIVAMVS